MRDRATFEKVIVFLCMALVICICWLSSSHGEEGVEINETNFPDLNFRKTVQRYFDTDKNGRLDEDECDRVVSIDYDYHSEFFYEDDDGEIIQGPSDLTGIGIFTALRELNCLGCGLTKLDLSNNTALEKLDCEYNSLTQLDVSACVKLEYLNCACNELTKLDTRKCLALSFLDCSCNKLTELDISQNAKLSGLVCTMNDIHTLDVSKCPLLVQLINTTEPNDETGDWYTEEGRELSTDVGGIYPVSVSSVEMSESLLLTQGKSTSLYYSVKPLHAYNQEVTWATDNAAVATIDADGTVYAVAPGTAVITVTTKDGGKTAACKVKVPSPDGVPIDEQHFPDYCFREYLYDYDEDGNGQLNEGELAEIKHLDISDGVITDLTGIEYLTEISYLKCDNNNLTALDVSKNAKLQEIYCEGNNLTSLNISNNIDLEELNCSNNQLTSLDISKNILLEELDCSANKLTSLDATHNKDLLKLNCSDNQLTSLNTGDAEIRYLDCSHNQLTSLEYIRNPDEFYGNTLICAYNQLTSLDCSKLDWLDCSHNKLTSLEFFGRCGMDCLLVCSYNEITSLHFSNLMRLDCRKNKLTVLDLSDSELRWLPLELTEYSDDPFYSFREEDGVYHWYEHSRSYIVSLTVDTSVILMTSGNIAIDEEHYPDDCFRDCVRAFDQDGDGALGFFERMNVKEIYVNGKGIKDLDGIQYFSELTVLHCYDNKISSMDLSVLKKLTELDCSSNPISELDISHNTDLKTLICGNTNLKTLDLSENKALTKVMCEQYCEGWNELISINVSSCLELNRLVQKNGYADSVIKGHPYLYNHMLHGWWISNEDGSLDKFLFVGPEVRVMTNVGEYIGSQKKPDADEKIAAFVTRCYRIILHRDPDETGLQTWINELKSGRKTASEIVDRFVNSDEFSWRNRKYNDIVEILYKVMLGRDADPEGKSIWVSKLENRQPLAAVINGFCTSSEFNGICASYGINPGSVAIPEQLTTAEEEIRAFVQRCYRIILNRDADPSGMNTWFNELQSHRKAASEIIDRFMNSPELSGKNYSYSDSVEILYKAMLGRSSDAAGKAHWVAKLENGQPFAAVINGFCISSEFKAICTSYGIEPGRVKIQTLSGQSEEELSMLAYKAKEPITKKSESNPARVEIINPSDTIDMNIGTAVQAVYINEEKAKEFISRCYQSILGREASAVELDNWIGQMTNGTKTPDQIARGFLFSNEFKGRNVGNEDLVKILYKVYMNRDADSEGLKTWTEKLDGGMELKALLDVFAKTSEFKKVVSEMSK